MAKSVKKIPWSQIGLAVALGFAWSKLGLGAAIKDIQSDQVTGVVKPVNGRCPAGWVKIGNQCVKL